MTTSDSNVPPTPPAPEERAEGEAPHEETGHIPIFRMTKLVVEDEQTRVANSPLQSADESGLPTADPPSGTHPTSTTKSQDRYVFATQAIVTTPGGKPCVCRTVNVTTTGLLADGPAGKEWPLRVGMVCHVTLRRKTRVIKFDAEVMRVDPPVGRNRRPCFAFRISFLTREAQADLLRLIEEAKSPGDDARSGALRLLLASLTKAGLALVLAGSVLTAGWYFTRRDRALSVPTTSLVRGSIADAIASSSGEIVAEHRIIVRSSLLVPTVMKLSVRRGDRVTAGTVLAEPAADTLRAALNASRTKLVVAQAASVRAARLAQEEADNAAPPDMTPQQRAEKLQRGQDAAHRAAAAAAAAQTDRDARTSEVLNSQIIAPFDGVVVDVKIQPGDLVAPSAPICDLLDDTALRVNAQFDEADIGRIKQGIAAQVMVTGNKDVIRGAVDRIGEVVMADAKSHTVLVEIALLERPPLRPGTTAKATIVLEAKTNVYTLPRSALRGQDGKRSVFVVNKDGELETRDIQVGVVANDVVEVLGGLPEKAVIVADGSASGLTNGLLVRSASKQP